MTLGNPFLLQMGAAVVFLVIVGLWSQAGRRRRLAEALGGSRAAARLARGNLYRLRLERIFLLGLAAAALGIAAAEPRWDAGPVEPPPPPPIRSTVLAIDVSMSMQSDDVAPTRLTLAVERARELLGVMEGDRVGLLLFAGKSYPIAPPTHDHAAIVHFLAGVTSTIASAHDPGTLVSAAIEEAAALVERGADPGDPRTIVLIGDGETGEPEAAVVAALQKVTGAGVTVHAIGVGTDAGGGMVVPPAPFQLERRVVDGAGAPAVSRLDEGLLETVAGAGGGRYTHAEDVAGIQELESWFAIPIRDPVLEPSPSPWTRYDLTFWFTALALALLLFEAMLDTRLPALRSSPERRPA